MKISEQIQKLVEVSLSTRDKQANTNVSEVYHLWNHLVQRYNVLFITNLMEDFAKDSDLKMLLVAGKNTLTKHITDLENEMMYYGIPLPQRPPQETKNTYKKELFSDRHIYRRILRGIQSFLPTHTMAFVHSTSPKIRELFMQFLIEEMELYDKLLEYGKIKGYLINPPVYNS